MKDIKIWHIGNGRYYCKIPPDKRSVIGDREIKLLYFKDGRIRYLQYEITKREAEALMIHGRLNQTGSKEVNNGKKQT